MTNLENVNVGTQLTYKTNSIKSIIEVTEVNEYFFTFKTIEVLESKNVTPNRTDNNTDGVFYRLENGLDLELC